MNRLTTLAALFLAATLGVNAQKVMKAPAGGKAISDELIGIFFEDISSAADGGLYAELVQNGSFEYSPGERDGWGPGTAWKQIRPGHSLGTLQARMDNALNANNPTYMRLHTERAKEYYDYSGWKGFGIQNDGFDGIIMPSGLSVKNTSSDEVQCGGAFIISSMSNGAFQSCFPTNCMQASQVGNYTTQDGALGAGQVKSMETEWLPTAEGTCTVAYQLVTYKKNVITQKWTVDKYGPTITLKFTYSTSGISAVKSRRPVTYYDLMGRRVARPVKGLYIVNGKRVILK